MEKTKSFKSLLKMQEKMNLIVAVAKSQDLIQIEQDFKFRCVHCGECCKSYEHGIFLGVEDLIHWVKEEREYLLGCISFDKFTQKFRVISKQEFFSNAIKNPKTKREIISLNPRLEAQSKTKENEKTFQEYCVFFDEGKQRCSIYPFRPLICRLYPFPEQQAIRIKFQKLKSLIE